MNQGIITHSLTPLLGSMIKESVKTFQVSITQKRSDDSKLKIHFIIIFIIVFKPKKQIQPNLSDILLGLLEEQETVCEDLKNYLLYHL